MPVFLDEFRPEDYAEVTALWKATEGVGLNADSDSEEQILFYLNRNPGLSLVARASGEGNRIVAAVMCGHDGRRGYLSHLAVAEGHRGQGIGRRIVDECLKRLAKTGVPGCNVRVFLDNEAGQRFWKKLGWTRNPVGVWITPTRR